MRFGLLSAAPLTPWQRAVVEDMQQIRASGRALEPASSAETVRTLELDFILSFAPLAQARPLVDAARWGVWQYLFGDWARYRGDSDGFFEIVDDDRLAVALLAQLQSDEDTIRILQQGCIRSHPCLPRATRARLEQRCIHWPRQVCLALEDGTTQHLDAAPVRTTARARSRRGLGTRLAFVTHACLRTVRQLAHELLRHEQWNIGIIEAPIDSLLATPQPTVARWLRRPARHEFFADPFGIVRGGKLIVLCEYLDQRDGRGRIVALDADGAAPAHEVDVGPAVHRSYPYLLQHEGRLFCIPETEAANEVVLYESESFPERWRPLATLIAGRSLVDATPFQYQNRWWLAASVPVGAGAECELHLFHADRLLGPWRAHAANPVKVDVRSARPAGTPFWKDGVLYRPAQDCSQSYGGRVVINRVLKLTEQSFEEEPCATVEPPRSGPYRAGLHTLAAVGDITLIDSKRKVFVPREFRVVLRRLFKPLRRVTISSTSAGGRS
jgi:hypothetical protein